MRSVPVYFGDYLVGAHIVLIGAQYADERDAHLNTNAAGQVITICLLEFRVVWVFSFCC